MAQLGEQFDKLTISDYRKWKELNLLDGVGIGYHNYLLHLVQLSEKYKNQEDNALFLIHQFITGISSLVLTDRIDRPLIPCLESKAGRSFSIEDFTSANLLFLKEIIPETENALLRARFADIVWIIKREHNNALIAIESYLKTTVNPEKRDSEYDEILKRVIVLCKQLGKNEKAIHYISTIKERLMKSIFEETTSDGTYILDCANILIRLPLSFDERKMIRKRLNEYTEHLIAKHDYKDIGFFFEIILSLSQGNDQNELNLVYNRIAEVLCIEAEESNEPSVSGHLYKMAINQYRRIPKQYRPQWDVDNKINSLREKMRDSNASSLLRMSTISSQSIDLSPKQSLAENAMTGKDKSTALKNLCLISQLSFTKTRETVLVVIRKYPFSVMFPTQKLDDDGRVIAIRKGIYINDLESEAAQTSINELTTEFFINACHQDVLACILPGLRIFNREHQITEKELFYLCYYSNAVPPDRAKLWAKGLFFGFQEDFITATHMLVPQVEHMVRFALQTIGAKTSTLEKGIESENGLSSLLDHDKITMVIEEDFLPEIRALMTESWGANLRNRVAHGLLDDRYIDSFDTVYCWWFCLRFMYLFNRNIVELAAKQNATQEQTAPL